MLNILRAASVDGAATMRGIRAAFSKAPDPVLLDAESQADGLDVGRKMSQGTLEAMADEALAKFGHLLGQ